MSLIVSLSSKAFSQFLKLHSLLVLFVVCYSHA